MPDNEKKGYLCVMTTTPRLLEKVMEAQKANKKCNFIKSRLEAEEDFPYWTIQKDGSLRYSGQVFVPNDEKLREKVLKKHHCTSFAVHPGGMKMYQDIRKQYWWKGMKADVAKFVAKCLTCQLVKAKHQKSIGKLQSLLISKWK